MDSPVSEDKFRLTAVILLFWKYSYLDYYVYILSHSMFGRSTFCHILRLGILHSLNILQSLAFYIHYLTLANGIFRNTSLLYTCVYNAVLMFISLGTLLE